MDMDHHTNGTEPSPDELRQLRSLRSLSEDQRKAVDQLIKFCFGMAVSEGRAREKYGEPDVYIYAAGVEHLPGENWYARRSQSRHRVRHKSPKEEKRRRAAGHFASGTGLSDEPAT